MAIIWRADWSIPEQRRAITSRSTGHASSQTHEVNTLRWRRLAERIAPGNLERQSLVIAASAGAPESRHEAVHWLEQYLSTFGPRRTRDAAGWTCDLFSPGAAVILGRVVDLIDPDHVSTELRNYELIRDLRSIVGVHNKPAARRRRRCPPPFGLSRGDVGAGQWLGLSLLDLGARPQGRGDGQAAAGAIMTDHALERWKRNR